MKQKKKYKNIYCQELSELGLNVRSYNCLKNSGFETAMEVINFCDINGFNKLRRFRNFGPKSFSDVTAVFLEKLNIDLYDFKEEKEEYRKIRRYYVQLTEEEFENLK